MALLQRLQSVTRISRGLKRLNDIGDYLSGDISRGLSYEAGAVARGKAGSPVKLLQTDFRLSESLDFHLRSPTSVNVRHGSPYALYAEWTGPGEPDRFSTEIRLMESGATHVTRLGSSMDMFITCQNCSRRVLPDPDVRCYCLQWSRSWCIHRPLQASLHTSLSATAA